VTVGIEDIVSPRHDQLLHVIGLLQNNRSLTSPSAVKSLKTQQPHALRKPRRSRLHRAAERPDGVKADVVRTCRGGQDQQQF
jgi:hypothetical protein